MGNGDLCSLCGNTRKWHAMAKPRHRFTVREADGIAAAAAPTPPLAGGTLAALAGSTALPSSLEAWLDKHHARYLWSASSLPGQPVASGWAVGCGVAIVLLYPRNPGQSTNEPIGWGVATEPNTNDIAQTFEDVERRLGVHVPTPPGHEDPSEISREAIAKARKHAEGLLLACSLVERCHRGDRGVDAASDSAVRALRELASDPIRRGVSSS